MARSHHELLRRVLRHPDWSDRIDEIRSLLRALRNCQPDEEQRSHLQQCDEISNLAHEAMFLNERGLVACDDALKILASIAGDERKEEQEQLIRELIYAFVGLRAHMSLLVAGTTVRGIWTRRMKGGGHP